MRMPKLTYTPGRGFDGKVCLSIGESDFHFDRWSDFMQFSSEYSASFFRVLAERRCQILDLPCSPELEEAAFNLATAIIERIRLQSLDDPDGVKL